MWAGRAVVFVCVGCASIHSIESTTNLPLESSIEHRVVDDSMEFSVATEVEGHRISLAIEQQVTCATLTTPRTHRRRYVDRRVDPTLSRATWTVAAISIGGGVYGSLNADTLAAQSTGPDSPTAGQYQQYAGGLLIIGAVAATIGVIDGLRATDSRYDDGVIKGEATREQAACRRRASDNRSVVLRLANGHQLPGRSDERGRVTFDLSDVPEAGLPGEVTHLALGPAQVIIDLSSAQRTTIRSSLLADPTSRLAMDLLQQRRDACASVVASARASVGAASDDVSSGVLAGWQSAKVACGPVWTSSYEAELESVGVRVVETECRTGLRAVDEAFVNGGDVEEVSTVLTILHDRCTAPEQVARLSKLDAKLASAVKRIERAAAAEARRVVREEAAALQRTLQRSRSQRSPAAPSPTWPTSESQSCCKVCSTGKACGNTCISRSKTCHVGGGCACDG